MKLIYNPASDKMVLAYLRLYINDRTVTFDIKDRMLVLLVVINAINYSRD